MMAVPQSPVGAYPIGVIPMCERFLMTVLVWDSSTGKFRAREPQNQPPAPTLPPIWPRTPEWYPKDDHWRGGER